MRKVYPILLVLATLFFTPRLFAQQSIFSSPVSKSVATAKMPTTAKKATNQLKNIQLGLKSTGYQPNQVFQPLQTQLKGGNLQLATVATCGPDTVLYPQAKATGLQALGLGPTSTNGITGMSQWYPAPQSITISGFQFFAWVDSAVSSTVNLNCQLWNAGPDSMPTGAALASVIVTIDSSFAPGTLGALQKYAIFSTPVVVNQAYCLTLTSTNPIHAAVIINDFTAGDGLGEDLSAVNISGWTKLYSTYTFDADFLFHPIINYTITPGFSSSPTGCTNVPLAFTNTSSPIMQSPFYNRAEFFGVPHLSYTWNFGDGTGDTASTGLSHTYSTAGTYNVSKNDTMYTWGGICVDSSASNVTIGSGTGVVASFTYSTAGLSASFTDGSTGPPTSWSWDFGDGSALGTTQNPTHNYASNGTYSVCLTATNACGSQTVCQQVLIGTPPASSCDTITNITGTPTIYISPNGGWVSGNNGFGDSAKAEKFTMTAPFAVAEAQIWFFAKEGTNGVTINIHDANGAGGSPGTILGSQSITHAQIDTTGITFVPFSPPVAVNGDFFISVELSMAAGDTVGIVTNTNPQTNPATAWELAAGLGWDSYDNTWGLNISHAIWVVQGVQAGFTSAVGGLTATFTDNSIGASAWLWDFGDGNTSTQPNPVHTYATGGTYNVCQIVINNTCIDTVCQNVVVSCSAPVAGFTQTGTLLTRNFTDNSTGSPTSWSWDFGDGSPLSTQQNPSHTYATAGTYTVCLTATNACGTNTSCNTLTITCPVPVANFTSSGATLSKSFTDASTGSPTSWSWNFGDGSPVVTSQNPSHVYQNPGTYLVCLIASSPCGTDTSCTVLSVVCNQPVAAYTQVPTGLSVAFTDGSTNSPTSWFWDFGDGSTSNLQNPTHVYATAGYYTVCLSATSVCGTDSVCSVVTAGCPNPISNWTNATANLLVTFTDQTIGNPTSWQWDFGDGGTSNLQNPTHTYASASTFTVCLITTNACGSDTICKTIPTGCFTPVGAFTNVNTNLTIAFTDQTSNTPTTWAWTFGDGGTSNLQNPSHTYAVQGTYNVCLTTTNSCGSNTVCQSTQLTCPPPVTAFTQTATGPTVTFTDGSLSSPTAWEWDFGDGSSIATTQNPTHTYAASGTYLVCLKTTNACGSDSLCSAINVVCPLPTASFTTSTNLLSASFTDNSSNVTGWSWNFGDGSALNTTQNPTHNYASSGTYSVCLTVTNACGTKTVCNNVVISCPTTISNFTATSTNFNATFTDGSTGSPVSWAWTFGDGGTSSLQNPTHSYTANGTYTVCLTTTNGCGSNTFCKSVAINCPLPVSNFTQTASTVNYAFTHTATGNVFSWAWDFGDGSTSTQPNPSHTFPGPGGYLVCLTVQNSCGTHQVCKLITVVCPTATSNFNFLTTGNSVHFTSLATGSGISGYAWDFGDGSTSTQQNPTHAYTNTGTYTACLMVTNSCGVDTFCRPVIITCVPPVANFGSSVSANVVNLQNMASANSTAWTWDFGDGSGSTLQNPPPHAYAAPGTYTVCLTVSNPCGTNQVCKTVNITCTMPTSGFTVFTNGGLASFTDVSIDATSWYWTFSDGTNSTQQNPTHMFTQSGTYQVCLKVTNFCGSHTSCQTLIITCATPVSAFNHAQAGGQVNFTDNSTGLPTSWLWDFGDGATSTLQNPSHGYVFQGVFNVCLKAYNSCGVDQSCQSVVVTAVGVEDDLENSLHIYPNPTSGRFILETELPDPQQVSWKLTNVLGQQILGRNEGMLSGTVKRDIDLSEFSDGVYFFYITVGDRTHTRKVVKD